MVKKIHSSLNGNQSLSNARSRWLVVVFILIFLVILVRLFYWQIIRGEELSLAAANQHWTELELPAPRGEIIARDGYALVTNKPVYNLFLDRTQLKSDENSLLKKAFDLVMEDKLKGASESARLKKEASESARLSKLTGNHALQWIKLFPKISQKVKKKLESDENNGLVFQLDSARNYSEASTAAHLLGFVAENSGGQDQGYFGLEGFYNRELSGRSGRSILETDAIGNPIVSGGRLVESSQPGRDLITNIDRTVQFMVKNKLKAALAKYGAKAGTVSIMNPKTGAIIAMVAQPDYDPDDISSYPREYYSNPIINQGFEPGSTFKVLVMAAALNEGLVDDQTVCPCKGPAYIAPYTISTWDYKYHPNSSITKIIQNSDNVGMVFVSQLFKPDVLVQYVKDFGFGKITGVDLEEEWSPSLRKVWRKIDLATVSFGQGISLTPLQMLTAVGTLANDGWLMQPQVVDKIRIKKSEAKNLKTNKSWWKAVFGDHKNKDKTLNENEEIIDIPPKKVRQVVSSETATKMKEIMVNSAKFGEAKWTFLKGYEIAGKTGTAQIPIAGHYDDKKTITSFVGFAPADDPKFVMLVTMREPETSPWGSETAAPLWFDIARELFLHYSIAPEN